MTYCNICGDLNERLPKGKHTERCKQKKKEYRANSKKTPDILLSSEVWGTYSSKDYPHLKFFLKEARKKFRKDVVAYAEQLYREWCEANPGKDFGEEKEKMDKQKRNETAAQRGARNWAKYIAKKKSLPPKPPRKRGRPYKKKINEDN